MKSLQNILAIDIGAGTQDILLYNSNSTLENCVSMILPSPARHFARMIEQSQRDLLITGDPIGGGTVTQALQRHLKKGFRVTMSEDAAYTVRNNLSQVMQYGIAVSPYLNPNTPGVHTIHFQELNWPFLKKFLSFFENVGELDLVAVAVQDHGVPPAGISNRVFRFTMLEQRLREDNRLASFVYTDDDIPACYKRMGAVARRARFQCGCEAVAMDTCFAALLGCLEENPSALVVNVGNSHTMAAQIVHGTVTGLFEHHTGCLTTQKLDGYLARFMSGNISSEEVLNDGGHGVIVLEPGSMNTDNTVVVTGPNRSLLRNSRLNVRFAAPHGNMMLTGPFGLLQGACLRYGSVSGFAPFG